MTEKTKQVEKKEDELPCEECGLCYGKDGFVPRSPMLLGTGPAVEIMVIGQNPTHEEDQFSEAYTGFVRNEVEKYAYLSDIPKSKIYYTNAVKCRTKDAKNIAPKMVNLCSKILESEVAYIKPKMIITLGKIALKAATKQTQIMSLRGTILTFKYNDKIPVVPTYHPSFVSRYPQHEAVTISDFRLAKSVYDGDHKTNLPKYRLYSGREDFGDFLEYLNDQPEGFTTVDIETNGLSPWKKDAKILSIAFCNKAKTGWAVPLYHKDSQLTEEERDQVIDTIAFFMEDTTAKKGYQNLTFDVHYTQKNIQKNKETKVAGTTYDTMPLHYLAVSEEESHALKPMALRYTDMGEYDNKIEEYFKHTPKNKRNYEDLPLEDLLIYNAADVDATLRIELKLREEAEKWGVTQIYKFLIHATDKLREIRENGVVVDLDKCDRYTKDTNEKLKDIETDLLTQSEVQEAIALRIKRRVDMGLNVPEWSFGSTQALRVLYFDVMDKEIKEVSKTSGEPSLAKGVLKLYSDEGCEISNKLLQHRVIKKELSMYGREAVDKWIHDDGLAHPQFFTAKTKTGRLASASPNYQNFPKEGFAKHMIVPRLGPERGFFMEVDYSQNEVRGLCNDSGEPVLKQAFLDGIDVHAEGARQMFDYKNSEWARLKEEQPKKWSDLRQLYKKVIFGVVYGKGPKALAGDLWEAAGRPKSGPEKFYKEADHTLKLFFEKHPKVKEHIERQKKKAKKQKYLRSRFGRVRRLDAVDSEDEFVREECLRQAVNFPIQSWSADVTLISTIRFHELCVRMKWPVWVVGTVHDSVCCDGDKNYMMEAACSLRYIMERPPRPLDIPLEPGVEVGPCWGEKKEINIDEEYEKWLNKCDYMSVLKDLTKDNWGPPPLDL